jgi:hypothetical protein
MAQEDVRKHLRAALDAVVSAEKARIHSVYNKSDNSDMMMVPVIAALDSLKQEVGNVEGLEVTFAPHGHMATVTLKTSFSQRCLSISRNMWTSRFQVEDRRDFLSDSDSECHEFSSVEDILKLVVDAVGKHIALIEASGERRE